jgi:hypothetical protein
MWMQCAARGIASPRSISPVFWVFLSPLKRRRAHEKIFSEGRIVGLGDTFGFAHKRFTVKSLISK